MWAASELFIVVYILGYASKFVSSSTDIIVNKHNLNELCMPGKTYILKCNRCKCDQFGSLTSCTQTSCDAGNNNGNEIGLEICKPGTKIKARCNECVCTYTSSLSCKVVGCTSTARDKTNDDGPKGESIESAESDNYHPSSPKTSGGTRYKIKTRALYGLIRPKPKNKRAAWPDRALGCELQEKVTDNCTTCYCGRRGLEKCQSTCKVPRTLRVWPNIYSSCPYGKIYFDGCNTCRCDENFPFVCKVDTCFDKNTGAGVKYKIVPLPTTCSPGETYAIDSCQTCKCSHPEWSCRDICKTGASRNYTADKLRTGDQQFSGLIKNKRPDWPDPLLTIKVGAKRDDGCKTCKIGIKGLSCNAKQNCVPREDDEGDFPAIKSYCPYGIQYFDGCNNCACVKGSPSMPYVCTKHECPGFAKKKKKILYALPDECSPGEVHILDDCLLCECSSDYVCSNICSLRKRPELESTESYSESE